MSKKLLHFVSEVVTIRVNFTFCVISCCTDICLKNGGKRTSEYLDICLNMLSKWLVRISLAFWPWKQLLDLPGNYGAMFAFSRFKSQS